MLFVPVFDSAGAIVAAQPADKEATEVLQFQPNDVAKGIANANAALGAGQVTRKQMEDLSHASSDWARFTRFITDVCFPSTAKP